MSIYDEPLDFTDDYSKVMCKVVVSGPTPDPVDAAKLENAMTRTAIHLLVQYKVKVVRMPMTGKGGPGGEAIHFIEFIWSQTKPYLKDAQFITAAKVTYKFSMDRMKAHFHRKVSASIPVVTLYLMIRSSHEPSDSERIMCGHKLLQLDLLAESIIGQLKLRYPAYRYKHFINIELRSINSSLSATVPSEISEHRLNVIRSRMAKLQASHSNSTHLYQR